MRSRPIHIVLAVCLVATPCGATDEQVGPQSLQSLQRSEQQDMERRTAEYPQLAPIALRDALIFRMENNALAVFTRLPPTVSMSRVKVDGLPGLCVTDVHGAPSPEPSAPYSPTVLLFMYYDFSKPGSITAALTVQVTPMNMQVSQDIETPTGIQQVSLIQNFPGLGDSEPPVRLRVSIHDKPGGEAVDPATTAPVTQPEAAIPAAENVEVSAALNIERTAPDFVTLRRRFPAEMARYVEPIFRELHADTVIFGADRKLALQVFASDAQPDPQLIARVKQIVTRLDSDDFREREAGAADLKRLDERAVTALTRLDRGALSPEQNSRIDSFLSACKPVSDDDARRLRDDVDFLIDCLHDEDDFIVRSALARWRELSGREIRFDNTLRGDARRAAVNALRDAYFNATTQPSP